jgi:hypothetical protein
MNRDFGNQLFPLNLFLFFSNYSIFWKVVSSVSRFLLLGSKWVIGNGQSINFWLNTWHNDYPLSIQFSLIYVKTKTSSVSLCDVWNMGNIKFNLTRGVSLAMRQEKSQLLSITTVLCFTPAQDSAIWRWEPSSTYTIKSLYNFLCFCGIKTKISKSV